MTLVPAASSEPVGLTRRYHNSKSPKLSRGEGEVAGIIFEIAHRSAPDQTGVNDNRIKTGCNAFSTDARSNDIAIVRDAGAIIGEDTLCCIAEGLDQPVIGYIRIIAKANAC